MANREGHVARFVEVAWLNLEYLARVWGLVSVEKEVAVTKSWRAVMA